MMHNVIVIFNVHNVPEHLSRPESLNSCVAGGSSSGVGGAGGSSAAAHTPTSDAFGTLGKFPEKGVRKG